MSKLIYVLVHKDLVPPNAPEKVDRFESPWVTEYDVISQLKINGHSVKVIGLYDELSPLLSAINEKKPDLVFNMLEEFNGNSQMDYHIVALLEALKIKYTGCNSKGLAIAKDKALSKKILKYHHLGTPIFFTLPRNKKRKLPKNIRYPQIIKCLYEEASLGIAQASIVTNEEKLWERVRYIHEKLNQDAIIEEFIEGKELYVGILGNNYLKALPIWELKFENVNNPEKEIYSQRAKWNENYRQRKGIETAAADLDKRTQEKVIKTCKKVYQVLNLTGYARIDLRLTKDGKIYILEANPNPNIASDDEFAKSAAYGNMNYANLIEEIIK